MEISMATRLKHAWNAFFNRDPTKDYPYDLGYNSYYRPDRTRLSRRNERSIITAIYNRIAMDAAAIDIRHVRLDDEDRYLEQIPSKLNNCLSVEANIDQTGREFIRDAVLSMLDEGCIALVPIDTTTNPDKGEPGAFDVETIRVGKIVNWYPMHVMVSAYNEVLGRQQEIVLTKQSVAIVENPFYAIMNEHNSTLQRLLRKLNLLDVIDDQLGSGKMDLIIQLPYIIKTEARRVQADARRKEIERQLSDSKYGIAYTDATERITQLNRPVENNLLGQVEYLTNMLFSQLGITQGILDGTADEATMQNYYNRVVEPVVAALADNMKRKFLTKTARTQKQSIEYFRDPFRLVPVSQVAEIADKFTRNEIMSPNEIRQIVGMRPSKDKKADELRNRNLSQSNEEIRKGATPGGLQNQLTETEEEIQNG